MTGPRPSPEQLAQLASRLGARITAMSPVRSGHSEAGRWLVALDDGDTAFLKVGADEPTRDGLALEVKTAELMGSNLAPRVLAYVDLEFGCLATEDLSGATWPPPWNEAQIAQAFQLLDRIAGVAVPADCRLGRLEDRCALLQGWQRLASDPAPFVGLGIRAADWLADRLERLIELERSATLDGSQIVHRDLRSDNVCFPGTGCRIVDWAGTEIGNRRYDAVSLMISIRTDAPQASVARYFEDGDLEMLVLQTGFLASRAGKPDPYPGSPVRSMQRAQLVGALDLMDELW